MLPEDYTAVLLAAAPRIANAGGATHPDDENARSRIISTVRHGARIYGALWCTSSEPDVFTERHQLLFEGVSDLLALALQPEAIRTPGSLRLERLESLDRLLHTMAESLDIRQVFSEVSDVIRGGLPHDQLALTSWAGDGSSFRVYALSGAQIDDPAFWQARTLAADERSLLHRESYV